MAKPSQLHRDTLLKELKDELESLTLLECHHVMRRVAIPDLVQLLKAIRAARTATIREVIEFNHGMHTHTCVRCDYQYTPNEGENEDCPKCKCDGTPLAPGSVRVWDIQSGAFIFSCPGVHLYSVITAEPHEFWDGKRWSKRLK
jgi:predicted Zn-ribbon and HTH transcriptional regulator